MKNFAKRISALVLAVVVSAAVLCPAAFAAQLPSLPKGECVVDDAGVLSSSTVQTITDLNAQLESSCSGAQIGVLTVDYTGNLTTASNTLGADSAEVLAAQTALNDFSACLQAVQNGGKSQSLTSLPYYQGSAMHALYQADQALGAAIDQLYAKLQEQAADPMKMGAVQGQYGQFNSAGTIIGTLKYNEAVYNYRNEVGGFPANVLGGLAGVKEVEPFA